MSLEAGLWFWMLVKKLKARNWKLDEESVLSPRASRLYG